MNRTATPSPVLDYGSVQVFRSDKTAVVHDETAQREISTGKATVFEVHGPNGLHLTVHDTRWLNGDRDVRVARRNASPERFDVLVGRLRMGVQATDDGDLSMMLRVADPADARPTRKQVSFAALHEMAGVDPAEHLTRFGATALGTGRDLGRARTRTQNQLMVRFPPSAELVPVAAFMLTTVLPLARSLG